MPITPTYPGIYIQEAPSSTHTIAAAPTNIAVFIGYTHPLKTPKSVWGKPFQIFGFQDYVRQFGGFVRSGAYANAAHDFADMAEAVNQFFLNGGTQAYVIGLVPQALNGVASLGQDANGFLGSQPQPIGSVTFAAREITDDKYVMTISVRPNLPIVSPPSNETADIMITYGPATGPGTVTETYRRVSLTPMLDATTPDPNYIMTRIGTEANPVSALVTVQSVGSPPFFPAAPVTQSFATSLPSSTSLFQAADFNPALQQDSDLDKLPIFNLMVLPGVTNTTVLSEALAFCERKRAFLIMDPPLESTADSPPLRIQDYVGGPDLPKGKNGALYFPYLLSPDPLTGLATNPVTGKTNEIPPAATVAGICAATDVSRGVWKAPAGFQATTTNTTGVVTRGRMTDQRQGVLNPLGVNCLRDFPNIGTAVFGARTLVTQTDEQWRYVPVRRMALFLEQTLYANLGWVVFEPNAEPLWTAIAQSISTFMMGLFRQGAFQGTTPSQAFNVQCNSQTTTQADINNGIVNIVVAFAPLKPAEFVVITIAQLAGQTQTS
jgi:uncharacterized protein